MTNTNTAKHGRFDNRQTVAKGLFINVETREFTPFECVLSYTRSIEKAVSMVRETCHVPADTIVTVTELQNERPRKAQYDNVEVYFHAIEFAHDMESADTMAQAQTQIDGKPYTVFPVNEWQYEAYGWMKTDTAPETVSLTLRKPFKLTKRAKFDAMMDAFELNYDKRPLSVYCNEVKENKLFAIIETAKLETCKRPETR